MTKKQPAPKPLRILPANTRIFAELTLGEGDEERGAQAEIKLVDLPKRDRATLERIITKHCQSK